jgi:hypothetical protein
MTLACCLAWEGGSALGGEGGLPRQGNKGFPPQHSLTAALCVVIPPVFPSDPPPGCLLLCLLGLDLNLNLFQTGSPLASCPNT